MLNQFAACRTYGESDAATHLVNIHISGSSQLHGEFMNAVAAPHGVCVRVHQSCHR